LLHRSATLILITFTAVSSIHAENKESNTSDRSVPNIVLILADDLGYETLGCYGGLDFKTPHLDRLAKQGVRLARAYTSPVCTPSRMSFYTSRYTAKHQFYTVLPVHLGKNVAIDFGDRPTVQRQFQQAGYRSAVTGKWQLATLEYHPDHVRSAGFESWCVWQIWRDGAKTTRYWQPCFNHDGKIRDDIAERFGPDVLADYVIDQMRLAIDEKRPFYIHHNMLLPHWPITETPDDRAAGRPASLRGMIAYMDKLVGRLVTAVDELGVADNTWIFFIGDNGTDSKQPRRTEAGLVRGGKHHLDDAGMHIPVLIRGPGLPQQGAVRDQLVDMTDFFPTLCELAGIGAPSADSLDGVSIVPWLLGKSDSATREFVTAGLNRTNVVFDGQWRLHGPKPNLIDCRALPQETGISVEDPAAAAALPRLQQYYDEAKRR
ncbi:MAG: sulfatase-like hydrolase/transferase, partial [Planctomycetales bacterium]|nr:sulfatase-like hydrolase/transferase [Planctomycetales bacterium]